MSKFKAGDIVECRSLSGRYEGWIECLIVEYFPDGFISLDGDNCDYAIFTPEGGNKGTKESYLRHRKPPEQKDNQAGNWADCLFKPDHRQPSKSSFSQIMKEVQDA